MSEPLLFWTAAFAAAFFVGSGKGGVPMIAILAVPTLSLVMPPMLGAALLLPVYLASDAFGIWIYRKSFSRRNLAILGPAATIGVVVGWLLADRINEDTVRVIIGVVGLAFLSMQQYGRYRGRQEARPAAVPAGLFWGSIAGFTSFVSHAGSPAFQMYTVPQKLEKMVFAGTSTILFAYINLIKVPPYVALGLIEWGDLRTVAILTPMAILGAWIGYKVTLKIPQRTFFIVVEIALLLISINLIRVGIRA